MPSLTPPPPWSEAPLLGSWSLSAVVLKRPETLTHESLKAWKPHVLQPHLFLATVSKSVPFQGTLDTAAKLSEVGVATVGLAGSGAAVGTVWKPHHWLCKGPFLTNSSFPTQAFDRSEAMGLSA